MEKVRIFGITRGGSTILAQLQEVETDGRYSYVVILNDIHGKRDKVKTYNDYGTAHEYYDSASKELLRMFNQYNWK